MTDPEDSAKLDEILQHVDPKAGLASISPAAARERYLDHRRPEVTEQTLAEYADRLGEVVDFCDRHGIEYVKDLDGAAVDDLRVWIREEVPDDVDEYSPKTMRDYTYLLRNFLRYLESIEAVPEGLHRHVDVPDLPLGEGVDDELLEADRARTIIEYLTQFQYASAEHVVWLLLAATGGRRGDVHALDLGDCHLDHDPYLDLHHRPDQGTGLKNGRKSERQVSISASTAAIVDDYITNSRNDVTDEYGREPLLTSRHGRLSKSTITKYAYKWSRPCALSEECPHGREVGECEAARNLDEASKCPSSRSPHAIRTGYLTNAGKRGIPKDVLSDRCDVSEAVLEEHYQFMSEADQRELRREILEEMREEGGGYVE